MGRRLFYWELAGFLLTGALGTLLHFVYEWSGGSALDLGPTAELIGQISVVSGAAQRETIQAQKE